MSHKTLKEAYESVGLMPQVGDVIDGSPIIECCSVPNSCFITFTQESDSRRRWLRLTDKIASHYFIGGDEIFKQMCLTVQLKITRDGKQIYPPTKPDDIYADIRKELQDRLSDQTVDNIFKLIDAKIKEAIK